MLNTDFLFFASNVSLNVCMQITRLHKEKEHVEVEFIVSFQSLNQN